jgi:cystathionine beta-lyase/cystathionine gamma-synthase
MANGKNELSDATLCARGERPYADGAVTPPIYQTSTFRFDSTDQVAAYARGESDRYIYTRYANPSLEVVEKRLAMLEHGERAYLFASGSAATAAWCQAHLRPGDRLVASSQLYGGTMFYMNELLRPFGVIIEYYDFSDLESLATALSGAKACWFETPTNPTMRIIDGPAVASLCRQHKVLSAVDNTFATPLGQKPLTWGVDWVMHSATKYLNGHDDIVGGALVASAGIDLAPVATMRRGAGAIMDPHCAFLLYRGMKTLSLRVERHSSNAMALAQHLSNHPKVSRVHYPGVSAHPGHEIARRQMRVFGGMLAIDLAGGYDAAAAFVDHLKIIINAASLGGVESLASMPILTSHVHATPEERATAGVTDGTVRISVGLESIDDLIADVDSALTAA